MTVAIFGSTLVTGILTVDELYVDSQPVADTSEDTQVLYTNGLGMTGDYGLTFNNSTIALQVSNISPFPGTATWYLQNTNTTGSTTITANDIITNTSTGGSVSIATATGDTPSGHGTGGTLLFTGATTTTGGTATLTAGNKGASTGSSLEFTGGHNSNGGGYANITGDGFVATGTLSTVSAAANDVSVLGGNAIDTNNGGDVVITASTNLSVATEATAGVFSKVYITTNGVEYRLPSGSDVVVSTPAVGSLIGISTGGGTATATTEAIAISGGATLSSTGVLSLASQYVTTAMINSSAVTTVKIADGAVGPAALEDTVVTPGSYTRTSLTATTDGRITAASSGGTIGAIYVYHSALTAITTGSTVAFDTTGVSGSSPTYNSGTGVFTLTSGKIYRAFFSIQHTSASSSAALTFVWQNASTLASIGNLTALSLSNDETSNNSNSPNCDIFISGTTHSTVRVYCTNATVSASTAPMCCGAFIYEINR